MNAETKIVATAAALVAPGKGILAADESFPTIAKRFAAIGVESTEDSRRTYREMLFTAPGSADFISGIICFDETLRQKTAAGVPFPEAMKAVGIVPGIKVDSGAKPLAGSPNETVTEGLDGLRGRLKEYGELGAGFAKWRAVITIADDLPTDYCLHVNAHALARYAKLCQEAGIVPIVEPEVLMDGSHTIERCLDVTRRTLQHVFNELDKQGVVLEGMLLKPNMVLSGNKCPVQADVPTVADLTVKVLRETVPAAVPGIVFLSGGQSDEIATEHLDAMNKRHRDAPWRLSFSYGRALQHPALMAWAGKAEQLQAGRDAFMARARANSLATLGKL